MGEGSKDSVKGQNPPEHMFDFVRTLIDKEETGEDGMGCLEGQNPPEHMFGKVRKNVKGMLHHYNREFEGIDSKERGKTYEKCSDDKTTPKC